MKITDEHIDPALRRAGRLAGRLLGPNRSIDDLSKPESKVAAWIARLPRRGVRISVVRVPRVDAPPLRLLVLQPRSQKQAGPSVLWLHGGGYAGGSPDGEVALMTGLVRREGAIVVSPDYRLSKEAPYPAA